MKKVIIVSLSLLFSFCGSTENEIPEQKPSVVIQDANVVEGDDGITVFDYIIRLQESVSTDITLTYETDDASAFQQLDFIQQSGQVTIPAGSMMLKVMVIILPVI